MLRREVRARLEDAGPGAQVVVLGTPGRSRAIAVPRRLRRAARVRHLDPGIGPERLHSTLAAAGRLDLIVVDAPARRWPRLLELALFHLRPGGALVFRGAAGERRRPLPRRLRRLDRVRAAPPPGPSAGRRERDLHALAHGIGGWRTAGPHVLVTCGVTAWAKLSHDEVDRLLPGPGLPRGRVLAQVPGTRFRARCEVTQSPSVLRHTEPGVLEAPTVSLREYRDVVCAPRQVVVADSVVLPDSYRHSHRRRYRSSAIPDLGARFAALADPAPRAVHLPGTYLHLDSEFQGHYGHLVTEQLSRLWAWPQVRRTAPDARVLMSTLTPRTALHPHERELLGAFGIQERDVVLFDRPVRVDVLLSAAPMLSHPVFVHPAIAPTWQHVGDVLAAQAPERERPRRIFCARRTDKRACRNAAEVERLFVERGFTIVYAEDHSLAEQAALFREAEVIAGYAGAAMFNLCYTTSPKDVVLLVSESYTAQNEYLIAAVQGHRLHLAWCPADVAQPARGFAAAAYQSDFVFDHARAGAWLADRLDAL